MVVLILILQDKPCPNANAPKPPRRKRTRQRMTGALARPSRAASMRAIRVRCRQTDISSARQRRGQSRTASSAATPRAAAATCNRLYGGAHYTRSGSAGLTLQGDAIVRATRVWGGATIPWPVCKKKYQPFRREATGERIFACHLHNAKRAARLKRCGSDERWESFAQWHGDKAPGCDLSPPD